MHHVPQEQGTIKGPSTSGELPLPKFAGLTQPRHAYVQGLPKLWLICTTAKKSERHDVS